MGFASASQDGIVVVGNGSCRKDFVTLRLRGESLHQENRKLFACLASTRTADFVVLNGI